MLLRLKVMSSLLKIGPDGLARHPSMFGGEFADVLIGYMKTFVVHVAVNLCCFYFILMLNQKVSKLLAYLT